MSYARAKRLWGMVFDSILPQRCLLCGDHVTAASSLCPPCWGQLSFINGPVCACCGLPFDYHDETGPEDERLCAVCLGRDWPFTAVRSVLRYDAGSRGLILAFKHADRLDLAPLLSQWMMTVGRDILADADVIMPVPLHRFRLFRRRYNQSAILAKRLCHLMRSGGEKSHPVEYEPVMLRRRRNTPRQGGLNKRQRHLNVQGAFVVPPRVRQRLEGRVVVLVDDVFTTGATLEACAATLRRAGAREVRALCLSRVVQPNSIA